MRLAEGQEGAKAQMPCNLLIASEASEEMLVIVHVYILQNPFFFHTDLFLTSIILESGGFRKSPERLSNLPRATQQGSGWCMNLVLSLGCPEMCGAWHCDPPGLVFRQQMVPGGKTDHTASTGSSEKCDQVS